MSATSVSESRDPVCTYPLTGLQEGMLYHHLLDPSARADIEQAVFTLEPQVDGDLLHAALQDVTDLHDVLRTSFRWQGCERPMQDVAAHVDADFRIERCGPMEPRRRARTVEIYARRERLRGFDLARAPLQRMLFLRFGRKEPATLIWTNHHAILDGRARATVLRDFAAAYSGGSIAASLPYFRDHVAWLEEQRLSGSEPFWREMLRGFAASTPLPGTRRAAAAKRAALADRTAARTLGPEVTAPLERFARAHSLTLTTLLHAAWGIVLARSADTSDVVFGVVRSGRHSGVAGSETLVGPCMNVVPLRVSVDPAAPLLPWLAEVRRAWNALREHEHTPLALIRNWSEVPAPGPLFESVVMYERERFNDVARRADADGALGLQDARMYDRAAVPLMLLATGTSALDLRVQYDPQRFGYGDAERVLDMVETIVRSFAAGAQGGVGDVPLLAEHERRRILTDFNRTTPYPRNASIPELFDECATRTPDAVAAELGDATITYRELAVQADRVAARLRANGIGRGHYVGLYVERSFEMLAGLLGIVKAGAASVALDPDHPAERTAAMMAESAVTIVLAGPQLATRLALVTARQPAGIIALAELALEPPAPPQRIRVRPNDAAHVMYTSGSTGTPKGAVIPHRAVIRTVRGTEYLHFGADETLLAFVPLTFDVAILEIWGALLNGSRLVIAPPGLPSLDELAGVIERRGVTLLWLTTALFEEMVATQLPRLRGVRGGWQGYQGQDFEGIVAFNEAKDIKTITTSFLEDQRAWIFYPTKISFYASDDSVKWTLIEAIDTHKSDHNDVVTTSSFSTNKPVKTKFIKVIASQFGPVPQWYEGSGNPSFIFIDEIGIQ